MQFVLFQNCLIDRHTHHYAEALGWRKACRERGIPLRILAHIDIEESIRKEVDAVPVFPFDGHPTGQFEPATFRLRCFIEMSQIYGRTLHQVVTGASREDVVIVPYATEIEVYGMALWLRSLAAAERPRVVFIFHAPDFGWQWNTGDGKFLGNVAFHRYGAEMVGNLISPDRILFFATNEALCELMSDAMQVPFARCPITVDYFEGKTPSASVDDVTAPRHAHIGIVGDLRREKGSDILPEVLRLFAQARPGKRIFAQVKNAEHGNRLAQALSACPETELETHMGSLPQNSYIQRLQSLDILLLPYLRSRYAYRVSAVYAEAVAYGLATVVPAGSWMAHQIEIGWGAGVIFAEYSAPSIANSLIDASDNTQALKSKTQQQSSAWRQKESTSALVDFLLTQLHSDVQQVIAD